MQPTRHFLITSLMEDRRNRLQDVAQYVGHRSPATTTQYYWHVDIEALYQRLQFPWTGQMINNTDREGPPEPVQQGQQGSEHEPNDHSTPPPTLGMRDR